MTTGAAARWATWGYIAAVGGRREAWDSDLYFTVALRTLMLASVIWHEMAHTEGLDEPAARRREEELWKGFVMNGRVGSSEGLATLAELRERR